MAYIARTDGTREQIAAPNLKRAQEIVGGLVERVVVSEIVFLCNEEGLLKKLPRNDHGCLLHGTADHGEPIVGDIIVMTRDEAVAGEWL